MRLTDINVSSSGLALDLYMFLEFGSRDLLFSSCKRSESDALVMRPGSQKSCQLIPKALTVAEVIQALLLQTGEPYVDEP